MEYYLAIKKIGLDLCLLTWNDIHNILREKKQVAANISSVIQFLKSNNVPSLVHVCVCFEGDEDVEKTQLAVNIGYFGVGRRRDRVGTEQGILLLFLFLDSFTGYSKHVTLVIFEEGTLCLQM